MQFVTFRIPLLILVATLVTVVAGMSGLAETTQKQDNANIPVNIIATNNSRIAVVRADLQQVQLRMFWQDSNAKPLLSFHSLHNMLGNKLLVVMNAGIFEETYRPLGLLIVQGQTKRRLNTRRNGYGNFYVQPNGVFFLEAGAAKILDTTSFVRQQPKATEATQSGPLLLLRGKINSAFQKNSVNRLIRNGICVATPKLVYLAISLEPINFYDFANQFKNLGCTDALYLDGSISNMFVPGTMEDDGAYAGMIAILRK